MNKGNLSAALVAELAAWQDIEAEPIEYWADDPEYRLQCRDDARDAEWLDWPDSDRGRFDDWYWEMDDPWDDWEDEYWDRIDGDRFANDATAESPASVAEHYQSLWESVGYVPRYIPFPYPMRAWCPDCGRLYDCYKPPLR